jgi:hypothetical protein
MAKPGQCLPAESGQHYLVSLQYVIRVGLVRLQKRLEFVGTRCGIQTAQERLTNKKVIRLSCQFA